MLTLDLKAISFQLFFFTLSFICNVPSVNVEEKVSQGFGRFIVVLKFCIECKSFVFYFVFPEHLYCVKINSSCVFCYRETFSIAARQYTEKYGLVVALPDYLVLLVFICRFLSSVFVSREVVIQSWDQHFMYRHLFFMGD